MLDFILSRFPDIDVDIYEAASTFAEIGAGVTIMTRTRRILEEMGLRSEIAAMNGSIENDEGLVQGLITNSELSSWFAGPAVTYHKADGEYLMAIVKVITPGRLGNVVMFCHLHLNGAKV